VDDREPWKVANQRFLAELVEAVYDDLVQRGERGPQPLRPPRGMDWPIWTGPRGSQAVVRSVCDLLGLDRFERDLLVLAAAMELDGRIASLCEVCHGNPQLNHPTLSLALTTFAGARWDAISPESALRRYRLVELDVGPVSSVARLKADPRVVFGLLGIQDLDPRLRMRVQEASDPVAGRLSKSQGSVRDAAVGAVRAGAARRSTPIIQLLGDDQRAGLNVARSTCEALELRGERIPADVLPTDVRELEELIALWRRETMLSRRALILDLYGMRAEDRGLQSAVNRILSENDGVTILVAQDRWNGSYKASAVYDVGRPTLWEQQGLWSDVLGGKLIVDREQYGTTDGVEVLTSSFDLDGRSIQAAVLQGAGMKKGQLDFDACWEACRVHARANLTELAQRVESKADWGDLVLPPTAMQLLIEIEAQVRNRLTVYGRWGLGGRTGRGKGIAVMFSGPSGVGKTLAAEVLANRLRLDLWRIDLSAVVSKYIGETQKNLRRVFDAAEGGGAVLLFDEADSLFSKRTQVKDHHDRHANMEVGYLLQRMEAYRGLAILTTNMKSSIDGAFVRRLRYMVEFPFPDFDARAEIWRRVLPETVPTEGISAERLAQLHVTGAVIRSVAINAAFRAADEGVALQMRHMLSATRRQYQMLGQPLSDLEIDGWVEGQMASR
jgi:hypothetical protein